MKIAIIGSGISGLSLANLLKEKHEVTVFEKEKEPGGLIKCERVNDCLFHKVGGHVFNAKNKVVLDWFWSHFDKEKEFVSAKRKAKVLYNNQIIGYPIENNIYHFPPHIVKKILGELLFLNNQPKKDPFDYDNFGAFLLNTFGKTLYELYFKPYNEKIWKIDLTTVSMNWLEGKLPMPNILEILESNIVRTEEDNMVHSNFFYPKEGGSQFIVDRLKSNLNLRTNENVDNIREENGKLLIGTDLFDKMVFCGDVRNLPKYVTDILQGTEVDLEYIGKLRSNGTSNLFCETDPLDISWLYIPESFTSAHRIIYTGNFSETNNRGSSRKTCVVEFSGKVSIENMKDEIKKLPGNLYPLSHNYENNSYVIQDNATRDQIKKMKQLLQPFNIYLLGRFAEWEYYNMDKAIEAAMNLSERIQF